MRKDVLLKKLFKNAAGLNQCDFQFTVDLIDLPRVQSGRL